MVNSSGKLRNLIPEFIYENDESSVFIKLLEDIYKDIKKLIDEFPHLVDVDNVSEIFLPKLSALIGYHYDYTVDVDVQREIIKRILEIYKSRGTDDSIIMAATYGDYNLWVGDHLFLPGAYVDRPKAKIEYPSNRIFRHSKSKHSSIDKYADSTRWRDGVLIIKTSIINDRIRDAIKKVVPAGVKIYFEMSNDSNGEGNNIELTFGEWTLIFDYLIDYDMRIQDKLDTLIHSAKKLINKQGLRSGRQIILGDLEINKIMKISMLPYYNKNTRGSIKFSETIPTDKIRIEIGERLFIYKEIKDLKFNDLIRVNDEYYSSKLVRSADISPNDEVYIDNVQDTNNSIIRYHFLSIRPTYKVRVFLSSGVSIYKEYRKINPFDKVFRFKDNGYILKCINNLCKDDLLMVDNTRKHGEIVKEYDYEISDIDYNCRDYQVKKAYRGLPLRSEFSSKRSGKFAMSGSCTGNIFSICEIEDINPSDIYYEVESIEDIKINGYLKHYCSPIQIEVEEE